MLSKTDRYKHASTFQNVFITVVPVKDHSSYGAHIHRVFGSSLKLELNHKEMLKKNNNYLNHFPLLFFFSISLFSNLVIRGGFRGGGLGGLRFLLRDSTPCRPKVPPLVLFKKICFWPTDPKIFLKAPLAPIFTNFEGGARAEKTQIFSQNFPKSA